MPDDGKVCTFDCLYCEAGFNAQGSGSTGLPSRQTVKGDLERKLQSMSEKGESLDVITFSGNGEPTLHPDFPGIIDDTIELRNRYYPSAKVSVLTNSTRIFDADVAEALKKVDNNILKLDSAVERTMRLLDRPVSKEFTVERLIKGLRQFKGSGIIQTMILRGEHNGESVDNTTEEEIQALLKAYEEIGPKEVMLYSIDRSTPEEKLKKVEKVELDTIADRFRAAGINVMDV